MPRVWKIKGYIDCGNISGANRSGNPQTPWKLMSPRCTESVCVIPNIYYCHLRDLWWSDRDAMEGQNPWVQTRRERSQMAQARGSDLMCVFWISRKWWIRISSISGDSALYFGSFHTPRQEFIPPGSAFAHKKTCRLRIRSYPLNLKQMKLIRCRLYGRSSARQLRSVELRRRGMYPAGVLLLPVGELPGGYNPLVWL